MLEKCVDYDKLDLLARKKYKEGGLPAMREFLEGVYYFGDEFYYIDYYGNAKTIICDDLYRLKYDLEIFINNL